MPTVAEYLPTVIAAVGPGAARTYGNYWARMAARWGERRLDTISATDIAALQHDAIARAVPRRNGRGGRHSGEHMIAAARAFFARAIADGLITPSASPTPDHQTAPAAQFAPRIDTCDHAERVSVGARIHPLAPLDVGSAVALLRDRFPDLSPAVRTRILADACGNPLALRELPAALTEAQRSGTAPLPATLPLSRRLRVTFGSPVAGLPTPVRDVLLLLALDGDGDLTALPGPPVTDAVRQARDAGLLDLNPRRRAPRVPAPPDPRGGRGTVRRRRPAACSRNAGAPARPGSRPRRLAPGARGDRTGRARRRSAGGVGRPGAGSG
ncbi:hypothetical protein Vau01_110510 [Virgisporangium aurantiacum]|uniref:Core-binding (CB) domain-containing protein n=1 Tax=Virgisporangium aurantiacum TaxID=175570 RepID=A0A8J4E5Z5_9ACTN|nr:hypothetical protein Vau01_110510 [Virgisporangium aurantiacum]